MQQVEFYTVRAGGDGLPGGFHRIRFPFPGQTDNDVGDHMDARRLQPLHRIQINFIFIATANVAGGFGIGGLQAQLHKYRFLAVDLFQQGYRLGRQAIRAGADGQAHHIRRRDRFGIQPLQGFHRGIGIGKGLKIGKKFSIRYLVSDPRLGPLQLLRHRAAAAFGKIAATAGRAENAATGIQCAIPIGTGKACIQRQLIHLAAKSGLEIGIGRCIHLLPPSRFFLIVAKDMSLVNTDITER